MYMGVQCTVNGWSVRWCTMDLCQCTWRCTAHWRIPAFSVRAKCTSSVFKCTFFKSKCPFWTPDTCCIQHWLWVVRSPVWGRVRISTTMASSEDFSERLVQLLNAQAIATALGVASRTRLLSVLDEEALGVGQLASKSRLNPRSLLKIINLWLLRWQNRI